MAGKQAKTLSTDHIDDLLFFAERSRHPLRNRLIVLLSVKAGLRAAEIAKLTWAMLLDPSGEVGNTLSVRDEVAKKVLDILKVDGSIDEADRAVITERLGK